MPVYKQNTKKTTVSFKAAWTYCIYVNSILTVLQTMKAMQ